MAPGFKVIFGITRALQRGANNTVAENLLVNEPTRWERFGEAVGAIWTTQCFVCGGAGHEEINCGTRAELDVAARAQGVSWEWGAVKGVLYYEDWLAANPARASARSARAAARSRSRLRPNHR